VKELPRRSDVRRHKPRTGITRASGPGSEQLSLGSVDVPRNDSASSGVRACLYLRETALDMPFGLTTPGGEPVNNSSLGELVRLSPVYRALPVWKVAGRLLFNWTSTIQGIPRQIRVAGYFLLYGDSCREEIGTRTDRGSPIRRRVPPASGRWRVRPGGGSHPPAKVVPWGRQGPRHTPAPTSRSEHFWHRERAQNGPKAEELSASYRVGASPRPKIRASTGMQGVQWGLNYSGQMSQKKRRQNAPRTPRRSNDPIDRLRASQEALRRAQGAYEQALRKRSEAIREASEVHSVSDIAEALEISRSKVYEILGRFRTAKVASSPEQPVLPW
jgi:hypothetical protein